MSSSEYDMSDYFFNHHAFRKSVPVDDYSVIRETSWNFISLVINFNKVEQFVCGSIPKFAVMSEQNQFFADINPPEAERSMSNILQSASNVTSRSSFENPVPSASEGEMNPYAT